MTRTGINLGAAAAALCAAWMVSCATTAPSGTFTQAAPQGDRPALARLARRAASEASSRPEALAVAAPPGVQVQVLAPRAADDRTAHLPLEDALAEVARRHEPGPGAAAPTPAHDAETRDEALRHYVKGLDAALADRDMAAIFEFKEAAELDPTNPLVLRRLARQYLSSRLPNSAKAAGVYEQLLLVVPHDSEALFMLGLAATNRRAFGQAVAYLGRPRLAGAAFDHDAAAPALADYMLGSAFEQLGYDRAALALYREVVSAIPDPLATSTLYSGQLRSLYTRRGELWQSIGDMHCRLGEYEPALEAYRHSAPLSADPEALQPRVVYANLRHGRPYTAQHELASALDTGVPISERQIQLLGYLAEAAGDVSLLAAAVRERDGTPGTEPSVVRAVAVLLDRTEAQAWLKDYLDERPDDMEAVSQLLVWLLDRDTQSAVALAVALAEAHPHLAERYGDRLARTGASVQELLDALAQVASTSARAVIESRLLLSIGASGPAWRAVEDARATRPRDPLLARTRIEVAGALREPELLVGEESGGDALYWLALSRAHVEVGNSEAAVRAATRAVESAAHPQTEALVALARAHALHALTSMDEASRKQHAGDAARAARMAQEISPGSDEACELLLTLYRPGGMLADPERWAAVREALHRAEPQSPLIVRMEAANDIERGRFERALERLLGLLDRDPPDAESLGLAMAAWLRLKREDEADRWLSRRLDQRPGDPDLLSEWVALQVQEDRLVVAAERLESLLRVEPLHDHARRLLGSIYRRQGRADDAVRLARERLESQPLAIRRELELAAVFAGAGRPAEAVARLAWVRDRAALVTMDLLISALRIAQSVEERHAGELGLAFAREAVERFPDVPLQVYGTVMLGLAREGELDERFDELAQRALLQARGASGPTAQSADQWRQLAQALTDAGAPESAGRALRARIWAEPKLEPLALSRLTSAALLADAAADRPQASIQLLRTLSLRGPLPRLAGIDAELPLSEALYEISIIYALIDRQESAITLLREAIALNPAHAMALNNLGYTRLEMGHADPETQESIEQAHRLAPADANVLDTVGWLRYKQGMFQAQGATAGAAGLIERALARSGEPSPEVFDHLGDIRWRLGDRDGAAQAWRQAEQILENAERRDRHVQQYGVIQQFWGLRVIDPNEMYRIQNDHVLERVRAKLQSFAVGEEPPVAETFDEMETTGAPAASGKDAKRRPETSPEAPDGRS
jgi:tetratricopeptide (TPR) repeat protein